MPELVDDLKQPMTCKDAQYLEVEVGIKLKELGYGVWQAHSTQQAVDGTKSKNGGYGGVWLG